ncbi:4Fe-4S binding protein [Sulfuriflexus mobilis]|uniref:4Fe-4S binding protein n=1 Tax=Sulfuriflexus mobilis TaxID=1811807 RepID=UPI0018D50AB6|nr:4Fe-4S binding protein [Sulfuriflexus mobilis]
MTLGHFIFFGYNWTLGLDPLLAGEASSLEAVSNIIVRGFLPLLGVVLAFGWTSWKYGRLYCGWLCPHFSVVEMVNGLMRRASGKLSIWDRQKLSRQRPDGQIVETNNRYWWLVFIAVVGFAFLWAVVFLTYLLPPKEIYHNLLNLSLTRNQMLFISVATLLLSIEFMFARHLFCRFACAVGVFQSLVWMANKHAMVVSFERQSAADCLGCHHACEDECPMRLKPRSIKRRMFNCTECARCLVACEQVQSEKSRPSLLKWQDGQSALQESDR